ncbi:hypothetical protein GOBAR_DD05773 [Gossypium barbadense]|nr:hypothetical protein GOBAR_DD05773 [Gossypium barbadense]
MGAIDCYPNSKLKLQSMFLHRKSTNLISKAKEVALVAHPHVMPSPTIRSSAANLTRTMAAINKDGIGVDPHELDAIFEQKRSLRSKVRKALKNMDPILRSQEDNAIENIVVESSWFKASKSLCAYVSSPALLEVGTSRIISEVLSSSAKDIFQSNKPYSLYLSAIAAMFLWLIFVTPHHLVDLSKAANYLEVSGAVMQASDPVDLFIVPGLAFDKSGSRLGRSGGYYDLFLKNYLELTKKKRWKQPLLVALSYSVQIIEDGVIPVTPFDIPMDALVSPAGFIPISGAALRRCE